MLLTADDALYQRVAGALAGRPGYHLLARTADPRDAYALGGQGALDLILIDQRLAPQDPQGVVRDLRQRLIDVPLVVLTAPEDADYVRRALLAGARSYLPLQFNPASLVQTVDELAVDRGHGLTGVDGRTVAVASLKGGAGRTLIAANLAVALRQLAKAPAALVDGKGAHGDVEINLNLNPQHCIADLVDQVQTLEPEVLNEAMVHHASGVRVLAACRRLQDAERLRPLHLQRILEGLRQQYPWVVVDTGDCLDERLGAILDAANLVLLVTTPEVTSLRAARVLLQSLRAEEYPEEKIRLVVNRADLIGAVPLKEIERNLGLAPFAALADDPALVTLSVNRGVPLVTSHGRKPLARGLMALAQSVANELAPEPAGRRDGKGGRR